MKILTRQQRLAVAQQRKTRIVPLGPCINGWNTRDALDAMDPLDAVRLDNWYPDAGGLTVRNGTLLYASGLGGNVETLAECYAASVRKFIAAANGKIFDISGGGAVGAPLATGFTSNRWQTTNFNAKLFFANGVDVEQTYDGTTVAPSGWTGPGTPLKGILGFKSRIFAWESAKQSFWYAPVNNITGALVEFPLSTVTQFGGNVMLCTSFSHDGGDGVNDYFVIVMTTGEVIMYLGTDPASVDTWGLVGRYRISPPVNIRAVARYGADSYLTTFDDHIPLQTELVALKNGVPTPRSKISGAVTDAMAANPTAFGWEAIFYPKGRRLLVNVPNLDQTYDQHVFNTSQQSWTRFRGMASLTWGLYKDNLYYGSTGGNVYQADTGNTDGMAAILADGQQSWNRFKVADRKRVAAARPLIQSTGIVNYQFGVGFDFTDPTVTAAVANTTSSPLWDVTMWDVAQWAPETRVDSRWQAIGGTGTSVSLRLRVSAKQAISWVRTDFLMERGIAL